jgi:type IV secretory pathway VirB10-like protein
MVNGDIIHEPEEQPKEPLGGGRFNRPLGIGFVVLAMVSGIALALGVRSSGTSQDAAVEKAIADPNADARDRGEIADLVAHGAQGHTAPSHVPTPAVITNVPMPMPPSAPKVPSCYAGAGQVPQGARSPADGRRFSPGWNARNRERGGASRSTFGVNSGSNPTVTVHPPASVYTVMAGSVIPAVLVSGINSDLPGPILAQVSENVADSASGRYLLVPQGSRLIGVYQNASNRSLDLPRIEFRRRVIRLTADAPFSRLHRPPATDGTASVRPFKSLTVRMLESGRASTT